MTVIESSKTSLVWTQDISMVLHKNWQRKWRYHFRKVINQVATLDFQYFNLTARIRRKKYRNCLLKLARKTNHCFKMTPRNNWGNWKRISSAGTSGFGSFVLRGITSRHLVFSLQTVNSHLFTKVIARNWDTDRQPSNTSRSTKSFKSN
jgi:hypothetical protein